MIPPELAPPSHWPTASRRPIWAWGMSLCLHAALMTVAGLYVARPRHDAAPAGQADRPVSVAVVHRLPDRQELPRDEEPAAADAPAAAAQAEQRPASQPPPASVPPDFAPPIDLAGVLAEMTSAPSPPADAGRPVGEIDASGWLSGTGEAGPGGRGLAAATAGSQGTVSLFGVSGTGSRFVYIVDRSDSMNRFGGRPLRAAKAELRRSLATLTPAQSFQLVLYNDQPRPFRGGSAAGPVQMLPGDSDAVARAQRYLDSFEALGGTNHLDALRLALRMGPDIIFFLTDGHIPSLSPQEMAIVRRLAQRNGTIIHGIEFGTDSAPHPNTFVRRLAAENSGQYRYLDVRTFSDSGKWRSDAGDPSPDSLIAPTTNIPSQ